MIAKYLQSETVADLFYVTCFCNVYAWILIKYKLHFEFLVIGIREIFCQGGGAVDHLPKKLSHVPQIFTKESKRNEDHIATT